jgi:hypothetical protein
MDVGGTDESEDAPVRLARGRRDSDSALGGASTSSSSSFGDEDAIGRRRVTADDGEEQDEVEDDDDEAENEENVEENDEDVDGDNTDEENDEDMNENRDETLDDKERNEENIAESNRDWGDVEAEQEGGPDGLEEVSEVENARSEPAIGAAEIPERSAKQRRGLKESAGSTRTGQGKRTLHEQPTLKKRKRAPSTGDKSRRGSKVVPMSNSQKNIKRPAGKKKETEEQGASSGDEYTSNLMENYIGQIGACAALGHSAGDVLNLEAWQRFTEDERESLRAHLPKGLSFEQTEAVVHMLLSGEHIHFGSPRDRVYEQVASGVTHPRIKRWRQRVALIERRHHLASLRDYHARSIRRLSALKAPRENSDDALAHLAMIGGGISSAGDALLARPELVEATALAAGRSPTNDWDATRWRRVLDFRNQETQRYQNPECAFAYENPWGRSIVGPLKRGPALDGGRPREHDLLRNERPSHVTILCIVRDAASRMKGDRGTRGDICDLLRDSQYLREGATFQQLNTVVSGALDRLHYETNAPVQYDPESKEWCYLHNQIALEDFETPEWALQNSARGKGTGGSTAGGSSGAAVLSALRGKRKKKRRK